MKGLTEEICPGIGGFYKFSIQEKNRAFVVIHAFLKQSLVCDQL